MADCLELNAREESQEKGREIKRQIDGWLMDASPKSRQKLRELFLDEGFLFRHDADTTIGYLRVLMQIYEQERSAGEEPTVLDLGRSHQELIDKLTELKFLLWRIAFAKDRQAEQELLSLIKGGRVSPYLMKQVVRIAAADKKEALLLLAGLCLEGQMYRHTFHLLDELTRLCPGEEEALCLAAEFCGSIGNRRQAAAYLAKVDRPGERTESVRRQYG